MLLKLPQIVIATVFSAAVFSAAACITASGSVPATDDEVEWSLTGKVLGDFREGNIPLIAPQYQTAAVRCDVSLFPTNNSDQVSTV